MTSRGNTLSTENVRQIDEVFEPRFETIWRRLDSGLDEHAARELRVQVGLLIQELMRWIDYVAGPVAQLSGCRRLVIRVAQPVGKL